MRQGLGAHQKKKKVVPFWRNSRSVCPLVRALAPFAGSDHHQVCVLRRMIVPESCVAAAPRTKTNSAEFRLSLFRFCPKFSKFTARNRKSRRIRRKWSPLYGSHTPEAERSPKTRNDECFFAGFSFFFWQKRRR